MSGINKEFKVQREELHLTQQDAAVMLGVSRITYIKWETEPDTMPIGKYEQLIREFDRLRDIKENTEG
jgi:DNA-binding XRE family transcriptional regulator